ncbi:MAG: polysaccharide biosynthesis tyrosine autokinase [Planctomycetota bacterium]|jgi:capsular exopolysaccharide synthesis family protein
MSTIPTRGEKPSIVRSGVSPVRAATRPAADRITGKDVFRILRNRKLLILTSALICTVISIIVTLLWGFYWPLYTADAWLEVGRPRTAGLRPEALMPGGEVMDRLLTSTARVAAGRPVMRAAVKDKDLRRTEWFRKDVDRAVIRLEQELRIEPVPKSYHVRVSLTLSNPKEVADIVNAVASAAVKEKNARAMEAIVSDISRYQDQLEEINADLVKAQEKVRKKKGETVEERRRIAELQTEVAAANNKLGGLERKLTDLRPELARAKSAWSFIEALDEAELVRLPEVQMAIESDPILLGQRDRLLRTEAERQHAAETLGRKHPATLSLQGRVESLDAEIESRLAQLETTHVLMLRRARAREPEIIAAQLNDLLREKNAVEQELGDKVKEIEEEKDKYESRRARIERELNEATMEIFALQGRKDRIDKRLDELRLERSRVEVVSLARTAYEPIEPSWPKWSVLMPLGVIVGLVIGLGVAFLLEFVDTSIKGPADVSRRVDLPLLGMVPHSDDLEEEIEDMRLAFMTAPNSIVSEAYRQIRTTLLFSGPAAERKSLLVTSPLPGDGRTSVAMNLAGCVARSGHKVLLVDANFRQPTISELFSQAPRAGFSSALVGRGNWREQIHKVEENFFVLVSGPLPPNPAELLGSDRMQTLVQEMQGEYDQIIFDGAPCVVIADSSVLSTQVDGVILVVRAGSNTYGIVRRTRDILERVRAHVLGVVLNGVRVTAGGYLRKNYETYYQYQQQPRLPVAEETETK